MLLIFTFLVTFIIFYKVPVIGNLLIVVTVICAIAFAVIAFDEYNKITDKRQTIETRR